MISRNYSEKISFITFFPFFINIFTNAPGLDVNCSTLHSTQSFDVNFSEHPYPASAVDFH